MNVSETSRRPLALGAAALTGVVLWSWPAAMAATPRHALAIGAFMIVSWATQALDPAVTGLIGCYLFWALHVVAFPIAFGGFADSSTWFIFAAMLIGEMVAVTPLPRRLAFGILQLTGATYARVLAGVILADLALTFFVPSGVARVVVLAPVAIGLVEAFGLGAGSRVGRGLFVAMIYASTIFDKMILGGAAAITAKSAMEQTGHVQVLWSRWAIACAPALLLTVVITWWLTLRLFPPEIAELPGGRAFLRDSFRAMGSWSRTEKRVAALLLLALGLWSTDFWHHLSPAIVGIGVGLAAFLPGIGALDGQDLRRTNLTPVIFVGCAISMGNVLSSAGALADATAALAHGVAPLVHGLGTGSVVLYLSACVYHLLIGNEIAMIATSMPAMMHIAQDRGLDPFAVGVIWTLGSGGKLFLYQSTVLIVGHAYGYFDRRDLLKIGAWLTLAEAVVVLALSAVYWPLIGLG